MEEKSIWETVLLESKKYIQVLKRVDQLKQAKIKNKLIINGLNLAINHQESYLRMLVGYFLKQDETSIVVSVVPIWLGLLAQQQQTDFVINCILNNVKKNKPFYSINSTSELQRPYPWLENLAKNSSMTMALPTFKCRY